ncbi:MAG: TetR/AcrR family transcriptional regulator [Ilumatobacteraceae bacterium]
MLLILLEHAARLASIDGLDGLSIGRLAAAADMPKSSVYVLFGSKEELQLATIDAARASFVDEVIGPALASTEGATRLRDLCDGYLSYIERRVFPTGCFFVSSPSSTTTTR